MIAHNLPELGNVTRLGLATRGNTSLAPDDVLLAIETGVNYLNWCGHEDGLSAAIRQLGAQRADVRVAIQLSARTKDAAHREIDQVLDQLGTDYLDVVTYYYVEQADEFHTITSSGGAADALTALRDAGVVRRIGMTSHQRKLAAAAAASGHLDVLMIRYNAAHRGAEVDIFPGLSEDVSVVAFTCLRWGALIRMTEQDPTGFRPPSAADCYRFVLQHPRVDIALMAPNGRAELLEDLDVLRTWRSLSACEYEEIAAHGVRVKATAGHFP